MKVGKPLLLEQRLSLSDQVNDSARPPADQFLERCNGDGELVLCQADEVLILWREGIEPGCQMGYETSLSNFHSS